MAAFQHNAMLRAQFPTPTIRKSLQACIEDKALADIDDPKITVLVVTISNGKGKSPCNCHGFKTFVSGWKSTETSSSPPTISFAAQVQRLRDEGAIQ